MRARDLLAAGTRALSGAEARVEAELLLVQALGVSRAWLVAHADDEVEDTRRVAFEALVARRARGEPVAYITGSRGFHALELHLTPDVLIPRAETELLVELALARIPVDAKWRIADLGTGSGAIALSIARGRPRARVLATDASATALDVALANARSLRLPNVEFAQGDWCAALGDARDFDLIVSNPPYIAEGDPHLREGDLRFEPRAALASGADGLDAIRMIIRDARSHLREGGWLLMEHGFEQGEAVRGLLQQSGYRDVFTERDLEGRERVSAGRR
ncbi:MAG TPA: peptide chain release factor N(5)-glutamine methyltransferase [Rhodanobacteraceae bacterium]|nr:peptide chain release factor N(5)-glutamine methyltransferase [Rhodanobacteraceae bacterium]